MGVTPEKKSGVALSRVALTTLKITSSLSEVEVRSFNKSLNRLRNSNNIESLVLSIEKFQSTNPRKTKGDSEVYKFYSLHVESKSIVNNLTQHTTHNTQHTNKQTKKCKQHITKQTQEEKQITDG
ncbi:hypothetical protein KAOT1_03027 [Kordia algicida OT-1]|uniref:Uncharacterized protein n=1 Tax=Kordia algicida OT-1 TaxID=391587 RepID=A9DUY1_9FLAO|nr:hypothetical protein KAOT1_03027 [Kordia algicida OT-1]